MFAWGSIPPGSLFAGYVIGAAGARESLLVLAAILTVLAVAGTAARHLREARRPEELEPASMRT